MTLGQHSCIGIEDSFYALYWIQNQNRLFGFETVQSDNIASAN